MSDNHVKKIWYREPYVWLVILFPAMAVAGGIFTLFLAINSDDGLVVDDYYKQGLAINLTLERERVAEHYDLKAHVQLNNESKLVRITLNANSDFIYPEVLQISFLHSTRSGYDRQVRLPRSNDNVYEGMTPELVPGNWYLQIESDDWRLLETLHVAQSNLTGS